MACWWLLVRRHRDNGELAFCRCYSPDVVPLRELVRVAGRRWTVEESFQSGKGLAGLIALTCNETRRLFTIFVIEPSWTSACPQS